MDQGIALVLVVLAVLAGGVAVWAVLRKRLAPEVVALISATAAEIMQQIGATLDEELVREVAGAMWDTFAQDSKTISRQAFQDLVWRAVQQAVPMRQAVASQVSYGVGATRRRASVRTH